MTKAPSTRDSYPPLLHAQIRLVEAIRGDVAALAEAGAEHDEVSVDALANDLVGARLVIRAALVVPPPCGVSGAARETFEAHEREAGDLLQMVLAALRRR